MPEKSSSPGGRSPLLLLTLAGSTLGLLGCPGFGSDEPSALIDPNAPLCENVQVIMEARCNRCHGASPTDGAPSGLRLDVWHNPGGAGAVDVSDRIAIRARAGMPPATAPEPALSGEEQDLLDDWHAAGAPIDACSDGPPPDVGVDTGPDVVPDAVDASDIDAADVAPEVTPDVVPDLPPPTPTLAEVHEAVFTSCGGHHLGGTSAPWLELNEELGTRLQGAGDQLPSMPWITPGDTSQSYLWHKVSDTHDSVGGRGSSMPIGRGLSEEQLGLLEAWIDGGAPE